MKKIIGLLIASLALTAQPALAQQAVGGAVRSTAPTYVSGETRPLSLDTMGNLRVLATGGTGSAGANQVQGVVAAESEAEGNPVAIGCDFAASRPAVGDGQRASVQCSQYGAVFVTLTDAGTGQVGVLAGSADNNSASTQGLVTFSYNGGFDGTTWDRARFVTGALSNGTGTQAMAPVPQSAAAGALTNQNGVNVAGASSLVACSAACNGYGGQVNTGAVAVWVFAFNTTSIPADGALTGANRPLKKWQVAANTTLGFSLNHNGVPIRFPTGMTIACSTTGPYLLTASATCDFSAETVQ